VSLLVDQRIELNAVPPFIGLKSKIRMLTADQKISGGGDGSMIFKYTVNSLGEMTP
jgi:hypothetical protein